MTKRALGIALIQCCFVLPVCVAANAPASEASIKQLLELTQAHRLVDTMMSQMDTVMKNAMQQATNGQPVPPEAQNIFDKCHTEVMTVMRQQFSWEKLVPMYVRIYQKSFTQEELDGMIAFYKTPAGQAVITKIPVVMQNSMTEVQQMLAPMMQRIQKMQTDIVAEIQAEKNKRGG
jgi:hypothetical protein